MHNSPLGCQTWAIAIYLMTTGLTFRPRVGRISEA